MANENQQKVDELTQSNDTINANMELASSTQASITTDQETVNNGLSGKKYITDETGIDEAQKLAAEYGDTLADSQGLIQSAVLTTAEDLDIGQEAVKEYAEYLQEVGVVSEEDTDAAYELALANQRLNKGVQDLSDNMDTWSDSIKEGKTNSED